MSDKDQKAYFQEMLKSAQDRKEEDPYALENFGEAKQESRLKTKMNRIKQTFFGEEGFSKKFFTGVKMGATVGGIFGTLAGLVAFYKSRNIIYIPISALTMGASFGFFLGVGTLVRSEELGEVPLQYTLVGHNGSWVLVAEEMDWKKRFKVNKVD